MVNLPDAHDWFSDAAGEAMALIDAIIDDANGQFTSQQKAILKASQGTLRGILTDVLTVIDEKLAEDKRDEGPPVL